MRAAWYRGRSHFRGRLAATFAFALVSGLVAAVVLAGIAGARRTERAFDSMVTRFRPLDVAVFVDPEAGPEVAIEVARILAGRSDVAASGAVATALLAEEAEDGTWDAVLAFAGVDEGGYREIERPLVLRGREVDPSAPNEIVVNELFAASRGIDVGSQVELALVPSEQLDVGGNGAPIDIDTPPERYDVVGVIRKPSDLAPPLVGVQGTIDEDGRATFYLSPAFWAEHGPEVASYGAGIILQLTDPTAIDDVREALAGLPVFVQADDGEGEGLPAIERAIGIEARSMLAVSVIFGAVAFVLVGQSLRRQATLPADEVRALAAIGLDRRSLVVVATVQWGLVGLGAAGVGALGAVALSPLAPIGIARRADRSFGIAVDGWVLAWGALAVIVLVALAGAVSGWRSSAGGRSPRGQQPSALGRWLARSGVGPSGVVGARMALEPGRGATAVPARSALVAAVFGVAAIIAAVTFASSLDRVVEDPYLRGWNWDFNVGNFSDAETAEGGRQLLLANPGIEEFSGWQTDYLMLDGQGVPLLMLDTRNGVVAPPVLAGRLPTGAGDVALGRATRTALDLDVGDEVEAVGPSGEPVPLRVVGESVGIGIFGDVAALDEGAILTFEGARALLDPEQGIDVITNGFTVRLADGGAGVEGLAQLRRDFPGTVFPPTSTSDIENLRRVQWLPRLLASGIMALAVGAMAHSLISAVRRRRRDLAVLKTIGFGPRQLVSVATAQATTFVLVALLPGVPLGIVAGRALWLLAADTIGTAAGPRVPLGPVLLAALGGIAAANLLALLPGRAAARTPAAQVLRAE